MIKKNSIYIKTKCFDNGGFLNFKQIYKKTTSRFSEEHIVLKHEECNMRENNNPNKKHCDRKKSG